MIKTREKLKINLSSDRNSFERTFLKDIDSLSSMSKDNLPASVRQSSGGFKMASFAMFWANACALKTLFIALTAER